MKRNPISLLGLLILGVVIVSPFIVQAAESASKPKLKLFDGKAKLLLVNGYSTSFHWPKVLQAKLDKHFDGKRIPFERMVLPETQT